jgi:hypothetical protein
MHYCKGTYAEEYTMEGISALQPGCACCWFCILWDKNKKKADVVVHMIIQNG